MAAGRGTFFQLINDSAQSCEVLYIVSPAYVFEMAEDGRVLYDDALVLDEDWEALAAAGWQPANSIPRPEQRAAATQRLALRKGKQHPG